MTRSRIALAAGDAAALLVFAVIGLVSHDRAVDGAGLLRDFVPVASGFAVAAALCGTYRAPGLRTLLPAWAAGITLGVAVRALALRHLHWSQLAFLLVSLLTTLALLLAWRLLARATLGVRLLRPS